MYNTNNPDEFVRYNGEEFQRLVTHLIVSTYNYRNEPIEDIIQEIYLYLLKKKIIEQYKPPVKISTFLYAVCRNLLRSHRSHQKHTELISDEYDPDSILPSDNFSDLQFELDAFGRYLRKKKKIYHLSKRRDKSKKNGFSLYIVYSLLRAGYSIRDIAREYGVSDTFVSNLKKKIQNEMYRFGIRRNPCKKPLQRT